ncbi:alpha/beta hydrolase [Shimwellia pseudoproteus]|uniref:alpha/beta hydrolase n=1 Tax=Shimwellia pseudoproteus TaxID=570012 RepID=UPI0018EB5B27|nr:alpha/beta hydrolase [Shimwellia pseudoproteus]
MTPETTPYSSLQQLLPDARIIPLWPEAHSNTRLTPQIIERGNAQLPDRLLTGTIIPEMVLVPPAGPGNGIGVVILPGGGYTRTAFDKEGMDTANTLAAAGFTCAVVNYRMPGDGHPLGNATPLADAQRAVRLLRARSRALSLEHVMVVGFSAGGHLAGWLAARWDRVCDMPQDDTDTLSARPDLAALIYPVISMDENISPWGTLQQLPASIASQALNPAFSVETMVNSHTPPCFLVHATDDPTVPVANSLVMWQALNAQGVAADMHIVAQGGHGFGIRKTAGLPVADWPQWLIKWIEFRINKGEKSTGKDGGL